MRLLLDMNLSPDLCQLLGAGGHEVVHWSMIGPPNASDHDVMAHASDHDFTIVSHDLDFSAILAATRARAPSVIQIRTQDVLAEGFITLLLAMLQRFEAELSAGALVVVDESRSRVRILPMD